MWERSDVTVGEAVVGVERVWSSPGGRMGPHDLHCPHQGADAKGTKLFARAILDYFLNDAHSATEAVSINHPCEPGLYMLTFNNLKCFNNAEIVR